MVQYYTIFGAILHYTISRDSFKLRNDGFYMNGVTPRRKEEPWLQYAVLPHPVGHITYNCVTTEEIYTTPF